ncbi:uncharacterized protein [Leptinotarsa decemlineata]|uniref:uncharacterized protein n=1 Tax=Leptinotarsa decemlineata TaxID=7539 RepID=UPI003D303E4C
MIQKALRKQFLLHQIPVSFLILISPLALNMHAYNIAYVSIVIPFIIFVACLRAKQRQNQRKQLRALIAAQNRPNAVYVVTHQATGGNGINSPQVVAPPHDTRYVQRPPPYIHSNTNAQTMSFENPNFRPSYQVSVNQEMVIHAI